MIPREISENIVRLQQIDQSAKIPDIIEQGIPLFWDRYRVDQQTINHGLCHDFANYIFEELGFVLEFSNWFTTQQISLGDDGIINQPILIEAGEGIHWWIYYNSRHYDSETPRGVEDWRQLPIFNRTHTLECKQCRGQNWNIALDQPLDSPYLIRRYSN